MWIENFHSVKGVKRTKIMSTGDQNHNITMIIHIITGDWKMFSYI
jgi:hypothetical protein